MGATFSSRILHLRRLRDKLIDLELQVRGYPVEVLRTCPITPEQRIEDEPGGFLFLARLRVQGLEPEPSCVCCWAWGRMSRWWCRPDCGWSCSNRRPRRHSLRPAERTG